MKIQLKEQVLVETGEQRSDPEYLMEPQGSQVSAEVSLINNYAMFSEKPQTWCVCMCGLLSPNTPVFKGIVRLAFFCGTQSFLSMGSNVLSFWTSLTLIDWTKRVLQNILFCILPMLSYNQFVHIL